MPSTPSKTLQRATLRKHRRRARSNSHEAARESIIQHSISAPHKDERCTPRTRQIRSVGLSSLAILDLCADHRWEGTGNSLASGLHGNLRTPKLSEVFGGKISAMSDEMMELGAEVLKEFIPESCRCPLLVTGQLTAATAAVRNSPASHPIHDPAKQAWQLSYTDVHLDLLVSAWHASCG
ncbi:hypothetical protein CC80DRAFT_254098 [Byssothecium circinans]|uniref:Uncharacterized protein n=1 Tax=Byssothecium circinans TaxID=147558 RepID=A0A6A5TFY5_9PLEO|nr:hypothetical protein CC80DRAFT_254098 [Byssothecium circinans]